MRCWPLVQRLGKSAGLLQIAKPAQLSLRVPAPTPIVIKRYPAPFLPGPPHNARQLRAGRAPGRRLRRSACAPSPCRGPRGHMAMRPWPPPARPLAKRRPHSLVTYERATRAGPTGPPSLLNKEILATSRQLWYNWSTGEYRPPLWLPRGNRPARHSVRYKPAHAENGFGLQPSRAAAETSGCHRQHLKHSRGGQAPRGSGCYTLRGPVQRAARRATATDRPKKSA